MCDNCKTLEQYGDAISALCHGMVRVMRANPTAFSGGKDLALSGLDAAMGTLALSVRPDRDAETTRAFLDGLTPTERQAARDISDALGMVCSGNAQLVNLAMQHYGDPGAWPDDRQTCEDLVDEDDGKGRMVMRMPEGAVDGDPALVEQVKSILGDAAKKVAELTGASVEMQELHMAGGKVLAGKRTVANPGNMLPMLRPKGPTVIH